jgi:AcrR family transcriptional regulator
MELATVAKTARGETSRENLIEAAQRVFRRRGYSATTVRHIALEAGVALGGLYRHFTSKDEFIAVVLAEGMREINLQVRKAVAALPEEASFADRLKSAIRAQVLSMRQRGDFFDLAVRYERLESAAAPLWRPYREEVEQYRRFWTDMIGEAQRLGILRDDAHRTMLSFFLLGAVTWVSQWLQPGRRSIDRIAEDFTDFFLTGALAKAPASRLDKANRKIHSPT